MGCNDFGWTRGYSNLQVEGRQIGSTGRPQPVNLVVGWGGTAASSGGGRAAAGGLEAGDGNNLDFIRGKILHMIVFI